MSYVKNKEFQKNLEKVICQIKKQESEFNPEKIQNTE